MLQRVRSPGQDRLTLLLAVLCVIIGGTAVVWKAWDMFTPARRPMLQGWNDSFYYFWLPTVVINHDLDFSKPLATSGTITPEARAAGLAQPLTPTHLLPNKYPPGWALGSLPFFLIAHIFAPAGATGFEPVYLVAVWVGQIAYAVIGLWLAVLIIRRLVPRAPAAVAVLAVWLASPLVYYQSARVSLSHSQVFTLAMLVFWLTLRIRDGDMRPRVWAAFGFAAAMLVATRNITIVYLAFPAVLLARQFLSVRAVGFFLLGAAGPAAVQMMVWRLLYGSWIAYSYSDERFDFANLHLYDVLFSPRHGFFYWHPLMLIGIGALAFWCWRHPQGWPWCASFGAITLLNAAWPCWWFASSFGNRGFEVPIFFAMFGMAALLAAVERHAFWRRAVWTGIGVAVTWNLIVFGLFLTRRIPQEDAVTFSDNVQAISRCFARVGPH